MLGEGVEGKRLRAVSSAIGERRRLRAISWDNEGRRDRGVSSTDTREGAGFRAVYYNTRTRKRLGAVSREGRAGAVSWDSSGNYSYSVGVWVLNRVITFS